MKAVLRVFLCLFALLLGASAVGTSAYGQATPGYPAKSLKIVVAYPAGGPADWLARVVGERLSKAFGQPVVVENRPGASGTIGAGAVAKGPADGYTLLIVVTDQMVNNAMLFKDLPYDPQRDFAYLTQVLWSPAVLVANADVPVKSMEDFRRFARENRSKLSYASWSLGGLGHLAGETLNRNLNADMVHVPQKGEILVVNDVLAKIVTVGWASVANTRVHIQAGKMTALAVMGKTRSPVLPDVPTFAELGFTDPLFQTNVWLGFVVPAKTPGDIVQRLSREIRAIVTHPEVARQIGDRGFELVASSPEDFERLVRSEYDLITRRIRELGIEVQ